jgi:photosystem II stability/assembly factor-like uncharacterized protein
MTGTGAQTIYAVGGYGKAFKSTNGGNNWTNLSVGTTNNLMFIKFFDTNNGIIFTNYTLCLRTTNAGNSWAIQTISPAGYFKSGYFINNSTGWIIYNSGIVLKTTNSGNNWTQVSATGITSSNKYLFFTNENTGFLATDLGKIYKTTNSGVNWEQYSVGTTDHLYTVGFKNENTGWTGGYNGMVYRTVNGGLNWTQEIINTGQHPNVISFINPNTGWIFGGGGMIMKTTNGGNVFIKNIYSEIPKTYVLYQNYPNPFNPTTKIRFETPLNPPFGKGGIGVVTLNVYDILGKEVATLVDEKLQSGTYEVTFDGSNLNSGVYFYKLQTNNFTETKKLILLK